MELTDLLHSEECIRFLRLCEIPEAEFCGYASDYERFRALSKALPLAEGFPFTLTVRSFLLEKTGTVLGLNEAACDAIWGILAGSASFGIRPENVPKVSRIGKTLSFSKCVSARNLIRKAPSDFAGLCELVRRETASADLLSAELPPDFRFEKPNPFSVGQALLMREDTSLLLIQILREVSERDRCPILLRISNGAECLSLLEYLKESGQKNEIFCMSDDLEMQKAVAVYRSGRADRLIHNACRTDSPLLREALATTCPIGSLYWL